MCERRRKEAQSSGSGMSHEERRKSVEEQKDLGKNGRVIKLLEDIALEYDSSPSTMKWVDQALTAAILEKGKKSLRKTTSVSTTYKNRKKEKVGKTPVPPSRTLRTSGGQFTSTLNIENLLNAQIKQQVADNMGKGGALVYRTGRFAESVAVEKVTQSRQGALTAYYTYMKAPYQTFERGFAQGSLRRDPRKLIAASIREIARETLSHKLGIRVRRV